MAFLFLMDINDLIDLSVVVKVKASEVRKSVVVPSLAGAAVVMAVVGK